MASIWNPKRFPVEASDEARDAKILTCLGFRGGETKASAQNPERGDVSIILRLRSSLWAVGGATTVAGPCESERHTTAGNGPGPRTMYPVVKNVNSPPPQGVMRCRELMGPIRSSNPPGPRNGLVRAAQCRCVTDDTRPTPVTRHHGLLDRARRKSAPDDADGQNLRRLTVRSRAPRTRHLRSPGEPRARLVSSLAKCGVSVSIQNQALSAIPFPSSWWSANVWDGRPTLAEPSGRPAFALSRARPPPGNSEVRPRCVSSHAVFGRRRCVLSCWQAASDSATRPVPGGIHKCDGPHGELGRGGAAWRIEPPRYHHGSNNHLSCATWNATDGGVARTMAQPQTRDFSSVGVFFLEE
jgi:hypothetical protein